VSFSPYPCLSSFSLQVPLCHFLIHCLVSHLVLHLHCLFPLPKRVLCFVNWKFPFFILVIGNKAYILLCQLVACWQPLACRVSFILDIHVVHPCFEAHNIMTVLHSLSGDSHCVLYDVPDRVKVDMEGNIVVLLSPLVRSMPQVNISCHYMICS
jgi:hypothetical protein